jgi:hypothetical protein
MATTRSDVWDVDSITMERARPGTATVRLCSRRAASRALIALDGAFFGGRLVRVAIAQM